MLYTSREDRKGRVIGKKEGEERDVGRVQINVGLKRVMNVHRYYYSFCFSFFSLFVVCKLPVESLKVHT